VGNLRGVGLKTMIVARVDEKGRLVIPRDIREKAGLHKGGWARIWVEEGRIIIEPTGSVADNYYGVFKVEKWPKDLDEFVREAVTRWWSQESM